MLPPVFAVENVEFTLKTRLNSNKCSHFQNERTSQQVQQAEAQRIFAAIRL
jgi:hypothetical protein